MPLLELDVDVGEGLGHALPQAHEPVVDHDQPEAEERKYGEKNPETHKECPLMPRMVRL